MPGTAKVLGSNLTRTIFFQMVNNPFQNKIVGLLLSSHIWLCCHIVGLFFSTL